MNHGIINVQPLVSYLTYVRYQAYATLMKRTSWFGRKTKKCLPWVFFFHLFAHIVQGFTVVLLCLGPECTYTKLVFLDTCAFHISYKIHVLLRFLSFDDILLLLVCNIYFILIVRRGWYLGMSNLHQLEIFLGHKYRNKQNKLKKPFVPFLEI